MILRAEKGSSPLRDEIRAMAVTIGEAAWTESRTMATEFESWLDQHGQVARDIAGVATAWIETCQTSGRTCVR